MSDPGILSVDVGGSGVKGMVLDSEGKAQNERVRIVTPRPASPDAVIRTIVEVAEQQPEFDRVSIGFPGVVQFGTIAAFGTAAAFLADITISPALLVLITRDPDALRARSLESGPARTRDRVRRRDETGD